MVEEVFYYLEYKKIREMFIFENNKEWLEYENNLRIFIQNIQYKYKEKIGDLSLPYQLSKKTYGSILYSRYTEIPKKEIYEKSNRNRNRLQKIQYKG